MIVFVGDLHGRFSSLQQSLREVPRDATIIQVGDFGFYPNMEHMWEATWDKMDLENPVMFIDGNHEYHPGLENVESPTEVWPGLTYIPRGCILELDGRKVGFLGGAASPDAVFREEGVSIFKREIPLEAEILPLMDGYADGMEIFVAHTAPTEIINYHLGRLTPRQRHFWKLSDDWEDPTTELVQRVWDHHDQKPYLVCGHFHQSLKVRNVRVLDIEEVAVYSQYRSKL